MIEELRAENLLLIQRAELRLDPQLNVITGETGAGKTLLAHALDLLLGGKARRGIVRPGADEAYVEGVFSPRGTLDADPELADLRERVPLDAAELVLARRVTPDGRTRAYIQGRVVAASDLRSVASRLVSFYGQHEHRKLVLASAQLDVLDSFCGEEHLDRVVDFERRWRIARRVERDLLELREREGTRERELDLLEFELREIDDAAPTEGEEEELESERARLKAVESLRAAAAGAAASLDGEANDTGAEGAIGALGNGAEELRRAAATDNQLDSLAERFGSLLYEAQDLAHELRSYGDSLQDDPHRLDRVEERLDVLIRLKRKHGGSIRSVIEHAERCRAERERLQNAGEERAALEEELEEAVARLQTCAAHLGTARRKVARRLEGAVTKELGSLALADASFSVLIGNRDAGADAGPLERLGPRGTEAVEFSFGANPGVPAGPLREVASGGELSRVMLALMSVASASAGAGTVVFDELDAGVGGNTARTVGRKLRDLAEQRQVICITHLPQVASLAARHFRVVKGAARDASAARAEVQRIEQADLVAELCRMLGADAGDGVARRHAERLLQAA
jgi:DNA repair protein RecN (Recombination protein N)